MEVADLVPRRQIGDFDLKSKNGDDQPLSADQRPGPFVSAVKSKRKRNKKSAKEVKAKKARARKAAAEKTAEEIEEMTEISAAAAATRVRKMTPAMFAEMLPQRPRP